MNRSEILSTAGDLIAGKRAAQYGSAAEMFRRLAAVWSARLGVEITPAQACSMMANVKQIRSDIGAYSPDNAVDACGYEALAGELAGLAYVNIADAGPVVAEEFVPEPERAGAVDTYGNGWLAGVTGVHFADAGPVEAEEFVPEQIPVQEQP